MQEQLATILEAQTIRASALVKAKQLGEAVAILEAVIAEINRDPTSAPSASVSTSAPQPASLIQNMLECSELIAREGDLRETYTSLQQAAVRIARNTNDEELLSRVLHGIGIISWRNGDVVEASAAYEAAIDAARTGPEDWLIFLLEIMTAFLIETGSDAARTVKYASEFAALVAGSTEQTGTKREATAQMCLGHALRLNGASPAALKAYEAARAICISSGTSGRLLTEIERSVEEIMTEADQS